MKAMHPGCGGKGCSDCEDGYINVSVANREWYTTACQTDGCKFINGVRIVGPEVPPLPKDSGPCVRCKGPTIWEHLGSSSTS